MNRILTKSAVLIGLFLGALVCASLIFFFLIPGLPSAGGPGGDVFHRLLRDYDDFFAPIALESRRPGEADFSREQIKALEQLLDKLEKNARGAETRLSVLKRRRDLAFRSPLFLPAYREAAAKAVKAFPWSQPLAALAAEALLYGSRGAEDEGSLENYTSLMTEARWSPLVLAVRVLNGELDNPVRARAVGADEILTRSLPLMQDRLAEEEKERLSANLGLLLLLKGDHAGASGRIRGFSGENRFPILRRLAAEYFYDFGEALRAAEIFYRLGGEGDLLRSADALWLGGRREAARNIWRILSAGTEMADRTGEAGPDISSSGKLRSLYNLAASSADREEAASWLSRLYLVLASDPALVSDPCYAFGLIGYSRLMEARQAVGILEEGEGRENPLLDLELLRRQSEAWPMERTVAETWLLLGRHPGEERLYQWGAWYFNFQRKYEETAILVKTAGRHGIGGPWLDLNAALPLMREGKLEEAEKLLRASPGLQASLNLGRILESRHAPTAALEQYGTAFPRIEDPGTASRVQFRMAGCFKALGRMEESRQALRLSLELNPGNLAARLELQNLEP